MSPAECGTNRGYRAHLRRRDVPCRPCCDAHAAAMDTWRAGGADTPDEPTRYALALAGREPAEALTTRDRWRLVAEMHRAGMTDQAMAARARMTVFTAARIREGMGLRPRRDRVASGVAA